MFIDQQMAQKIVDRAMKITGVNVNVMDHRGVIIGSGDPLRVDQLHEGALHVLSSQAEVDIASGQEGRLSGVKGGVNLPIRNAGDIIGVVGITGEPEDVRKYADLVVMTAELIVEQAALTAEVQWDSRQRETLLIRLIEGTDSDSLFDSRLARLQLDLSLPRVVVVMELSHAANNADLPLAQVQQLQYQLSTDGGESLLAITSARHLVMLKSVCPGPAGWDQALLERQLKTLVEVVAQHPQVRCRLGVGDYYAQPGGLAQSYRSALKTLAVTGAQTPLRPLCFATDFALDLMLYDARDSWAGQHLLREFEAFLARDKNGTLQKTLDIYLAENMDPAKASQRLHIHRNTLRYRLDKIGTVLQMDLSQVDQLLRLLVMRRLYSMPAHS